MTTSLLLMKVRWLGKKSDLHREPLPTLVDRQSRHWKGHSPRIWGSLAPQGFRLMMLGD